MRIVKRSGALLLILALTVSLAIPALAAGTVTYDGNAQDFVFAPGTQNAPTNLFASFADMIPGDCVTETVILRNDSARNVDVTFYLRALGADEASKALLSQLKLTVTQGTGTLFEGSAADTAQLTDWVCLGTLKSGGETELKVTLEVPVTLDNAFQSSSGEFTWEFKAEEIPAQDVPPTGDNSHIGLYAVLAVVSLLGIVALLFAQKKKVE